MTYRPLFFNDLNLLLQIIVKDHDEEYVYFVQSGRCKVIQEVKVVKTRFPFGKSRLVLASPGKAPELSKDQSLEIRYLVIMTIGRGGYFGVGEEFHQTWIVSENKVHVWIAFVNDVLVGCKINCVKSTIKNFWTFRAKAFVRRL